MTRGAANQDPLLCVPERIRDPLVHLGLFGNSELCTLGFFRNFCGGRHDGRILPEFSLPDLVSDVPVVEIVLRRCLQPTKDSTKDQCLVRDLVHFD
ncbi:MAG: hypothetical protein JW395_1860 [Nitrospira sp.]|nr:hypothetical protein [Nitrospira sp.]